MTDAPEQENAPAIMLLTVTNRNDFSIPDMFNGVPVNFPGLKDSDGNAVPPTAVDVSPEIATHCFGWPGEDVDRATHMARRYGWGGRENLVWKPGTRQPLYHDWAMKVEIKPVYFDLVRRNPNDPIPADDGKPDDTPLPPRIEVERATSGGGKRNRKAATPRRLRDRHEASERVR